jgi:hypothetical protein
MTTLDRLFIWSCFVTTWIPHFQDWGVIIGMGVSWLFLSIAAIKGGK